MPGADLLSRTHGGSPPPNVLDFSAPSNPLGRPRALDELVLECAMKGVHGSYPTRLYAELYESLSDFLDVGHEDILPLNGASEALTLIPLSLRARSIIVVEPNFGDHEVMARGVGIELRRPLLVQGDGSFSIDVDAVIAEAKRAPRPAVVLLSRPNNPTGYLAPGRIIDDISARLPEGALLVIDEAFIELSTGSPTPPREDLVVVRSLTKAFSTPGLRLGAIMTANRKLLEAFASSTQAWPVDSLTACAFSRFLREPAAKDHVRRGAALVKEQAPVLVSALRSIGVRAFETDAPFVLIRHERMPNPSFQQALVKRGVYVRDCSSFFGLDATYSRVSVRAPDENRLLLRAVSEVASTWA